MAVAANFTETGGPEVLGLIPVDEVKPGSGQVWIEHDAIGVNYLDVTQRNGAVKIPLPSGLGLEGAGRVTAIGPDVTNVSTGDRVAYILGPIGSYSSGRLYPARRLIKLPNSIAAENAAAVLFKGITAHYLIHSTFAVGPGSVILAYGAAGALGQILVPWAKALGAFVIGVVSKEPSEVRAKNAGCDAVFVWGKCNLAAEVAKITSGAKADVVYDGIGKTTFATSLDCLRPRGTLVSLGASSGIPDPVSVATLGARGSLFLTRPGLVDHATDLSEYHARANSVIDAVVKGIINPAPWKIYPLLDVAQAHTALESGLSEGAIVLKP